LVIVAAFILHAVGAHALYKAGGFTLRNPLSYVLLGGFLAIAAFKIKYLRRLKRGSSRTLGSSQRT
jgi:hypothetical protein